MPAHSRKKIERRIQAIQRLRPRKIKELYYRVSVEKFQEMLSFTEADILKQNTK